MNTKEIIKEVYPQRSDRARKYDHGMVLVIGGSELYSGSPALSAIAALKSGADIVKIIAPRRAADIAASFTPALITFPLEGKCLSTSHLPDLLSLTRSAEIVSRGNLSVVIGGGAGRSKETKETIRKYLKEVSFPVIIDADAIYAFEEEKIDFKEKKFLFTPHLYEFFILTGKEVTGFSEDEIAEIVKEEAEKISSVILLKGKTDFISDGKEVFRNEMSVPYLTTGGCGDTLAGIAGAIASRGVPLVKTAQAAAAINTIAGDLAAKEKGESLLPTDLIDKIPEVIN